jgi:steroid delta-isomerase-like uncharacterized protein
MTGDDHRELLIEAWRLVYPGGDLDAMDRFMADDYVRHSDSGDLSREQFKAVTGQLNEAFPDLEFSIEDTVAEGDRVCYRWLSTGTHMGTYLGVPATHRQIAATGITISRFDSSGRIAEDWASWNAVSVLHSLGIIPIS